MGSVINPTFESSLAMPVADDGATIEEVILSAVRKTLETGLPKGKEARILHDITQMFPTLMKQFDNVLSILPEDVRGIAGATAVTLLLQAQAVGAFCYTSATAKTALIPKITTEAIAIRQKAAGQRSGQARREARPWVTHATDLATQLRCRVPTWSREKLATEIEFSWKISAKCPGHQTLLKFLRECERGGIIPPRSKGSQ